jgi:hypothetical protein
LVAVRESDAYHHPATVKAARTGKKPPKGVHFPTIDDGVKGLAFIEAAVKSSKANGRWVKP